MTYLLAIAVVAAAVGLLAVGVVFKKRTPLRGSCHAPLGPDAPPHERCDACSCEPPPQS